MGIGGQAPVVFPNESTASSATRNSLTTLQVSARGSHRDAHGDALDRAASVFESKRVALPPRIFTIMSAHSLAFTSGGEHDEGRSEVGIMDQTDQELASERAHA